MCPLINPDALVSVKKACEKFPDTPVVIDHMCRIGATGTVKDLGGTTHVTVQNLVEIEQVWADGNDTVIVADADKMNDNDRSDEGADVKPSTQIQFMTYLDFDQLNTGATTRKSFADQVAADEVMRVINHGQFKFNLSKTGTGSDIDRVDYTNEAGRIVVPVGQGSATKPQYVIVDGDNNQILSDAESRVDELRGVEEIVAAKGRSVLDFTTVGQERQITFQYKAPATNPAEKQLVEQTIRIADGSGNTISGLNTFVEAYTYNKTTAPVADATWNQIEGGDAAEVVIYQGSEDLNNQAGLDHRYTNDVLTLRGGNNVVSYKDLETDIYVTLTVTAENAATKSIAEGMLNATILFGNGIGGSLTGGGTHTVSSHSADNSTAVGTLKLEATQGDGDSITFNLGSDSVYLLGTSAGVQEVQTVAGLKLATLTGFERLQDSASDDIYDFRSIANMGNLWLNDALAPDHDSVKVYNDILSTSYLSDGASIRLNHPFAVAPNNYYGIWDWFGFDFDVLDITGVTSANLTTVSADSLGATEELVVGTLNHASNVLTAADFDSVVFTQASVTQMGTTFAYNTATGSLVGGAKTIAATVGDLKAISFGGLVFESSLRDGRVASVSSGINFAATGSGVQALTVVGGSGNDTITTGSGADVLIGGAGDDTLSGGYVPAVGPKYEVTLTGGASALVANGDNITIAGVTITAAAVPGAFNAASATNQIATGADADQVGAMFASVSLATWQAALVTAGATAAEAGTLTSVTYDGVSNKLVFTHNSSANATTIALTDYQTGQDLTGGTITATEAFTAFTAAVNTADRYVFEATAAKNGADTINNFNSTDTLDFQQFFASTGFDFQASGQNLGGAAAFLGGDYVIKGYNKTTLAASDFGTGKIELSNGATAVFITTGDTDNIADGTNNGYKVYFVSDVDPGAGITYQVDLVATVSTDVELTNGQKNWLFYFQQTAVAVVYNFMCVHFAILS